MPKRKSDGDCDDIQRKIKRLKKKLRRKQRGKRYQCRSDESESDLSLNSRVSSEPQDCQQTQGSEKEDYTWLMDNDPINFDLDNPTDSHHNNDLLKSNPCPSTSGTNSAVAIQSVVTSPAESTPLLAAEARTSGDAVAPVTEELDNELLDILGVDPTSDKKYGKDIHKDLSVRLQHWALTGLTKDLRKELKEKYLTPENCKLIDPPELNAEIKAAVSDIILKRDKAIEGKQKQLTLAITCLGEAISMLISTKEKNTALLKLLMDSARMMCNCQHADTVTRRNFLLGAVKKDVREQLQNSKVDKFLFGEDLPEILKSARAIHKSGTELKPPATKIANKKQTSNNTSSSARNLNWRNQGLGRKPTTGPPKTREQRPISTQAQHTSSSRMLQHPQQRQNYNRR
ncbi:uncharacterized protein LOC126374386 [Pectinophora gossypiella]|uniref:uncharacterized protein LOC126374386 n=1 Tax=Pectinophora gossypiella TaxID=13191 RepID=UPI00214F0A1E|nr:uncharacterized protein LOC126374386 [Pectinophora gossypiella]